MEPVKYNFYPFNSERYYIAIEDNKAVVKHSLGHLCGYVVLENNKIPKEWIGNYNSDGLQYLNIHGGLTYCKEEHPYTVFGFDCSHLHDDSNPLLQQLSHVMRLTRQMEQQLLEFISRYEEYRKEDKEDRIKILDEIRSTAEIQLELGFMALIDTLSGGDQI